MSGDNEVKLTIHQAKPVIQRAEPRNENPASRAENPASRAINPVSRAVNPVSRDSDAASLDFEPVSRWAKNPIRDPRSEAKTQLYKYQISDSLDLSLDLWGWLGVYPHFYKWALKARWRHHLISTKLSSTRWKNQSS